MVSLRSVSFSSRTGFRIIPEACDTVSLKVLIADSSCSVMATSFPASSRFFSAFLSRVADSIIPESGVLSSWETEDTNCERISARRSSRQVGSPAVTPAAMSSARSGATTGRPRRCGWFDGVLARYAARVNGFTGLAVDLFKESRNFERKLDELQAELFPAGQPAPVTAGVDSDPIPDEPIEDEDRRARIEERSIVEHVYVDRVEVAETILGPVEAANTGG